MSFNVIAKPILRDFWDAHADSCDALERWYKALRKSEATNFAALKATFGTADWVQPDTVIFNLKGNHYRIITRIRFDRRTVWIKHVFTHAEYDRWTP